MKLSAKYIDLSETQNVEFKSVWKDDFLKQICSFANTKGGRLLLGVDDKGQVIGLSKVPKLLEDLPNKIIQYLGIIADIETHIADGFQYVEINIEASSVPISYKGKFYVRSGSTTQELSGHELSAFILKKDNITWDEICLPDVDLGNIDKSLLLQFTKEAIGQNRLFNLADGQQVRDVLQNLNLLDDNNNLSRAAVLLFGINPQKYIRTATVKLGRFGTSDSDLISQDIIQGNLLQMPDQIMELLRLKYLTSTISYEGLTRVETLEYPEKALREIILNAIVHRDYGEQTDITIKIFEDRIVFWNSGLLLAPLNVEMLQMSHPSKRRNPLIADIFFRIGLIESWGRGTLLVTDEMIKRGMPRPRIDEVAGGVRVVLEKRVGKDVGKGVGKDVGKGLSSLQRRILGAIKENKTITISLLAKELETTSRTIERNLDKLKQKNNIRRRGGRKEGTWEIMEEEGER